MNYREKYKNYYNIEFTSDYQIHHIDGNRKNNKIENLILLPKLLHRQYHFYKNIVKDSFSEDSLVFACCQTYISNKYQREAMHKLLEIIDDCYIWYKKKEDFYRGNV